MLDQRSAAVGETDICRHKLVLRGGAELRSQPKAGIRWLSGTSGSGLLIRGFGVRVAGGAQPDALLRAGRLLFKITQRAT